MRFGSKAEGRWMARQVGKAVLLRPWLIVGAAMFLGACATANPSGAVVVEQVSASHYAPSQTVDLLSTPPAVPYEVLARLQLTDPTGTATSSQLIAQLSTTAQGLGAEALLVQHVSHSGGGGVAFNPSGGQMQAASDGGTLLVMAVAIRYTH
jgi:hypothetical protein